MSKTTALLPAQEARRQQLRTYLYQPGVVAELAKAMPKNLTPDRMLRQAMSLASLNPALLECTQLSVLQGIMAAAELGLELTGPLGHCWLIPRKVKGVLTAVFQVGWKGLVALALRSGKVGAITVRAVREGDDFEVSLGTVHQIHHKMAPAKDAGVSTHYYAIAFYKPVPESGFDFEVWAKEQVDEHKRKYCQDTPAWRDSYDSQAKKTVVAALCRRMSLCPEAQIATALDEGYGHYEPPAAQAQGQRTREVMAHLNQTLSEEEIEAILAQEQQEMAAAAAGGES